MQLKDDDDEALSFFANILPKIKEKEKENLRQIEFIQYPGTFSLYLLLSINY